MHQRRAVEPLQSANDEMAAREALEVLGESDIDRRAADRADDPDSLRRGLLRHDHAEARRNRADQTRQSGAASLEI